MWQKISPFAVGLSAAAASSENIHQFSSEAIMSIDKETTEIKAVLEAVRKGLYEKDATAIGAQYASDAIIFDLSPPLGHLLDVPGLAAWLDTWEGPVKLVERDLKITVSGDLAGFQWPSTGISYEGRQAARGVVAADNDLPNSNRRRLEDRARARIRALPHGWQLSARPRPRALIRTRAKPPAFTGGAFHRA